MARVVQRRGAGAVSRARRLWSLGTSTNRPAGRGRALACSGRWGDLGGPALRRQRHDRAMGGHAACAHDAGRSRAGPYRRRRGAGPASDREYLDSRHAPGARRCARAPRGNGTCHRRLHRGGRASAAFGSLEEAYLAHAELALIAAERGAWGEAAARAQSAQAIVDESGLGDYSSSALATRRQHALHSTKGDTRTYAQRWHGRTACDRSSTTRFPG